MAAGRHGDHAGRVRRGDRSRPLRGPGGAVPAVELRAGFDLLRHRVLGGMKLDIVQIQNSLKACASRMQKDHFLKKFDRAYQKVTLITLFDSYTLASELTG